MHSIQTPAIPVTVETAVSGTSTPSSIGQVRNDEVGPLSQDAQLQAEAEQQNAKWIVRWTGIDGLARHCGVASGGLSTETVLRLLDIMTRKGVWLFGLERVK